MVYLYHFVDLVFVDMHTIAHYVLYKGTYFVGLTFTVRRSSAKTTKIGPLISRYTVLWWCNYTG